MRRALVVVGVCLAAGSLSASIRRPVDVEARARAAGKVAVATVTDVEDGRFDVNEFGDRLIVSRAWLSVDETLKGPHAPVIAVDVEGGSVGDLTLHVSDMPALKAGDRAVFFLDPRGGAHTLNGRGHGVLALDRAGRVIGQELTLADVRARIRGALR